MKPDSQPSSDAQRALRIAEIRGQIAAGTYETAEKLEGAVDVLLKRLSGDGADDPVPPPARPR